MTALKEDVIFVLCSNCSCPKTSISVGINSPLTTNKVITVIARNNFACVIYKRTVDNSSLISSLIQMTK